MSFVGVSLAQDRGRLEARIEVLGTELETQKKQNQSDMDALKIKAKIIDDQTETIRKLKEVPGYSKCHHQRVVLKAKQHHTRTVHIFAFYHEHCLLILILAFSLSPLPSCCLKALQERDSQIRRMREEAVQAQKRHQQQLEEETVQHAEMREQLEHLSLRKEELKHQLEDKEAELEDVRRVHRQAFHHKGKIIMTYNLINI